MPRKKKEPVPKYKITRSDGRAEVKKRYKDFGAVGFTGVKHFYGRSDEEIDKKIADFEASLQVVEVPKEDLMESIVDDWWEKKEGMLSPNSVQSFKTKKNEITEEFGSVPVYEIKGADIQVWLNRYKAKGYSQRSINDRRSVMKLIMDYALGKGKIAVNPCSSVPAVKSEKPKVKRRPASEEDVKKIEAHRTDSLIARLYYFLEYSGCRIGEAAVLQERDIDRVHHKASITKDLAFDGNKPLVKETPKTEAGEREVDLYDNVLEILPQYADPDTYIFFPEGLPRRSRLQRLQKKYQESIGISSTAHQLRHTYASIMHSAEIDVKDTQARMGHANVSVTQDIYTEIEKAHNEKVRNKANEYIMNERLGRNKKCCPNCGSMNTRSEDGKDFLFCPECGVKLP